MKIGFYAGSCIPIHAHTLEERPLGGTETGLIRVAQRLADRGHEVIVFTSHRSPPPSTPQYLPAESIHTASPFDVLILVQEWKPIAFSLPSKRVFFWTGEGPEQMSSVGLGDQRVIDRIEAFFAVSQYQKDSLCESSGFPKEKTHIIGNGVHLPDFTARMERVRKRLIYASAPYRGLHLMGPIFRKVRELHPESEFHIFSGMSLYDRETPYQGPYVVEHQKIIRELSSIAGVVIHSTVTQSDLARELLRSSVLVYPATVRETCCMVALEAQAAGCALVTSHLGALPETVGKSGFVISSVPGSKEFLQDFSQKISDLLTSDERWNQYSQWGRAKSESIGSWNHVVEKMEVVLTEKLCL